MTAPALSGQAVNQPLYQRIAGYFASMDTVDLATRITLLAVLYSDMIAGVDWQTKAPMKLLAVFGLLAPPLHRSAWLWGMLLLAMIFRTVSRWSVQDNHLYLITYWMAALFLANLTTKPGPMLAVSGRVLIGLAFGFAVLWKAFLSPTYMDSTFFHFELLRDPRFADWATLTAGVPVETHRVNMEALASISQPVGGPESAVFVDTPMTRTIAIVMTWWTVAIESLIAVAFLWPGSLWPKLGRVIGWLRDPALIVFAWSTYSVIAVTTFGWVLCAMALAATPPDRRLTRFAYAATMIAVLVFEQAPIVSTLNAVLGR